MCAEPVPIYEDGVTSRSICPDEAAREGLTVLDLGDDWAPRLFAEDPSLGEAGRQPYRATFVALADEDDSALPRRQRGERFLELFGIPPTFRVLRARVGDAERHACHEAIDDAALTALTVALRWWSVPLEQQRRDVRTLRFVSQMYNNGPQQPDPAVFLRQFLSTEVATKANKWQGRNVTRWVNKEYDAVYQAAQVELDPVKRAALLIRLNEMVVNDHVVIPVVARPVVSAVGNKLAAELSGWDTNTWDLASWYREA